MVVSVPEAFDRILLELDPLVSAGPHYYQHPPLVEGFLPLP
jgi:hypothetical protein